MIKIEKATHQIKHAKWKIKKQEEHSLNCYNVNNITNNLKLNAEKH